MLEKMSEFFENRLDGYDAHMLTAIESADEFYPYTAECLPKSGDARILDLGCGTGLELAEYFKLNPNAAVTGIDLSEGMLGALAEKFPDKNIELIRGSYFDLPLGESVYDAALSVESLHHFTKEEKTGLYRKLYASLKDGGYFILTDYFSLTDEEEMSHRRNLSDLKREEGIDDEELYHYDTPITVAHESEALLSGGFDSVQVLGRWGATHTLKAIKRKKD